MGPIRPAHLHRIVEQLPRYSFLHPRYIDAEELSGSDADGDHAYVAYPSMLGVALDVIVITGRWRMDCAAHARALSAPGGSIIFQDWCDRRYEALPKLFEVVKESASFLVLRRQIEVAGAAPNIPPMVHRRWKPCFSPVLYRARNRIERFFNRIEHFRRLATRYEKHASNSLAMLKLAAIYLWLRHNESVT